MQQLSIPLSSRKSAAISTTVDLNKAQRNHWDQSGFVMYSFNHNTKQIERVMDKFGSTEKNEEEKDEEETIAMPTPVAMKSASQSTVTHNNNNNNNNKWRNA